MNDDAPPLPPIARPALGRPGIDWSGDGGLGGLGGAARAQAEAPRGIVPAGVPLRAAGFIIDTLILLGIAVVVSTVVLLFAGVDTSAPQDEMQREIEKLYPLLYVVEGAVQFVYNLVWNSIGWSPGKWMLRLRTVDAEGNPPRLRRGLVRTLGSVLSGSFFGLGYAWAIWDREHRTWHDRIARTYVVRLPAEDDSEASRRDA